jgi:hypothetical protein
MAKFKKDLFIEVELLEPANASIFVICIILFKSKNKKPPEEAV